MQSIPYLKKRKNRDFKNNIKSGISVSIVSLCLSIPLAVASGWQPMHGLLAAIRAGFFAALFGWSNYNIVWPAGALSWLLVTFLLTADISLLPVLTILTGVFILAFYGLKLVKYITLIPSTALHGFMMGVGLIIMATQLVNALGLYSLELDGTVFINAITLLSHISSASLPSIITFLIGIAFLRTRNVFVKKVPWILPLTLLWIILWRYMQTHGLPFSITTLWDLFPNITFMRTDLSRFSQLQSLSLEQGMWLVKMGFIVSIVAILETIVSAKIADKKTKTKHHEEQEVFGLWIANTVTWIFGGMPATGVFLRTALNIKSGATLRSSAAINAVFVGLIWFIFFKQFTFIPMAIVAAILTNLALGMIDMKLLRSLFKQDLASFGVTIAVGLITFIEDPMYGILAWTAVSFLIHIRHSISTNLFVTIFKDGQFAFKTTTKIYKEYQQSDDIVIIKLPNEINFINASMIGSIIHCITEPQKIVFSFSWVDFVDLDGREILEESIRHYIESGKHIAVTWLHEHLQGQLEKLHFNEYLTTHIPVYTSTSEYLEEHLHESNAATVSI